MYIQLSNYFILHSHHFGFRIAWALLNVTDFMVNVCKLLDSSLTACFHALDDWMYIKICPKLLAYNLSETFSFAITAIVIVNSYPLFVRLPVTPVTSPQKSLSLELLFVIGSLDVKKGGAVLKLSTKLQWNDCYSNLFWPNYKDCWKLFPLPLFRSQIRFSHWNFVVFYFFFVNECDKWW